MQSQGARQPAPELKEKEKKNKDKRSPFVYSFPFWRSNASIQ